MDLRVSLDGLAGALVVSVPWLLLAAVAWRGRLLPERDDPFGRMPEPAAELARVMSAPNYEDVPQLGETPAPGVDPVLALSPEPPVLSLAEQEDALVGAMATAKAQRDDVLLSRSGVDLARLMLKRAARPQAAVVLQTAALAARRAKLPVVHAEARLELAEIALSDGDLTSACEHWQMAKLMFHESGRRSDQDRVAELMRVQRCPTDWVLTNF